MAEVRTVLSVVDRMSEPIRRIKQNTDQMRQSLKKVQTQNSQAFNSNAAKKNSQVVNQNTRAAQKNLSVRQKIAMVRRQTKADQKIANDLLFKEAQGYKLTTAEAEKLKAAQSRMSAGKQYIDGTVSSLGKMRGTLATIGPAMIAAFAIGVVMKFIEKVKEALDLAEKAQQMRTKLTVVMGAMMGSDASDVQAINDLIGQEAASGVIGATTQRAGAQQMATYLHNEESLAMMIPAINDFLAQSSGVEATAEDAVKAANMFGKAFAGSVGMLRKAGLTFDAHQEAVLKTGTEYEKAAMAAEIVAQNVGDMNQQMAQTDVGMIANAGNQMDALKTKFGEVFLPVKSAAAQAGAFIGNKIADGLTKVREHLIETQKKQTTFFLAAYTQAKELFAPAIEMLSNLFQKQREGLSWLGEKIGGVIGRLRDMYTQGHTTFGAMTGHLAQVGAAVRNFGALIANVAVTAVNIVKAAIGNVKILFSNLWNSLLDGVNRTAGRILGGISDRVGGLARLTGDKRMANAAAALQSQAASMRSSRSSSYGQMQSIGSVVSKSMSTFGYVNLDDVFEAAASRGDQHYNNARAAAEAAVDRFTQLHEAQAGGSYLDLDAADDYAEDTADNTGDIADSSKRTADAVSAITTDLSYIRNLAGQYALRRLGNQNISVTINNTNNLPDEASMNKFVGQLRTQLANELVTVGGGA